ncbi:ribosome maturation factor RimM [Lachnospiraceae bacterium JLR.KK008]
MEQVLKVGVITSTHGIKGEVKIFPLTDDAGRFQDCRELLLDTGTEKKVMEVESVKYFKKFVILKFKGYDSINEIEIYKGKELYVTREHAVALEKDEYFIADLLGLSVLDEEDREIGILSDVIGTGANDVYSVTTKEGGEILLPAIKDCILDINIEKGQMHVHLLPGLVDE